MSGSIVCRSLNKVQTVFSCEWQMFTAAIMIGPGLLVTLQNIPVGCLMFGVFYGLGYYHAKDPAMLRIIFNARQYRNQYDPAKVEPFKVHFLDH